MTAKKVIVKGGKTPPFEAELLKSTQTERAKAHPSPASSATLKVEVTEPKLTDDIKKEARDFIGSYDISDERLEEFFRLACEVADTQLRAAVSSEDVVVEAFKALSRNSRKYLKALETPVASEQARSAVQLERDLADWHISNASPTGVSMQRMAYAIIKWWHGLGHTGPGVNTRDYEATDMENETRFKYPPKGATFRAFKFFLQKAGMIVDVTSEGWGDKKLMKVLEEASRLAKQHS